MNYSAIHWISHISFSLAELALNYPSSFLQCFYFFVKVPILFGNNQKIGFKSKQNSMSSRIDWSRNSEKHKTFEGWSIEFLSIICHFEISLCISKNWEFQQDFKNWAGDQLKLSKWEPLSRIRRVGMSEMCWVEV